MQEPPPLPGLVPATQIRPSLWYCLLGVLFFVIGAGLFAYTLFRGLSHITDSLTQVLVPGSAELKLKGGRSYTVFLEEQSIMNGTSYSTTTESIAGLECRVTSISKGTAVPIGRPRIDTTYSLDERPEHQRSGRSVLEFFAAEDGRYGFACDYGEGRQGPVAVVAVGAGIGAEIFLVVGLCIGEVLVCGILGLIVIVAVLVMRDRAKRRLSYVPA